MVRGVGRPEPLAEERAIVERAMQGDQHAFERIYRHYAPILFSYILVPMLGDKDDAHDCVRETFISANRALPRYEWRGTSIWPWLKVLAKNKARDLLRASGRRQRLRGSFSHHLDVFGDREPETPIEEAVQHQALRKRIDTILELINPRYARVLRLRLLEDRSREDCAELLEVKIGTLDVLLFRAVRAFRKACEQEGVEFDLAEVSV
ncbi:ECF RNA polymerase sigma-E factor [Enhygromyxa salina]|uniref:ECF RNA polymerase sigma-E factor n=1 Tax=Enhygromyxa salina TaxID=215803 RepID=A0A2S9YY81_9BACT|nr:ECF RNA polymerase sigma-E factor [Enhygromyxa salina]